MNDSHKHPIERFKSYFAELNIFSAPPLADIEEQNYQHRGNVIATRIYLLILFLILSVFTIATILIPQSIEVIVQHPSSKQFETLPKDTVCSCSQVSIPYSEFLIIRPSFHVVCSSDFVSDQWISSLYFGDRLILFRNEDIRATAFTTFRIIANFCHMSQLIVNQSLTRLNSDSLISPYAISVNELQAKISVYIEQFQVNAPRLFQTQVQLINNLYLGSLLLNGLNTGILSTIRSSSTDGLTLFLTQTTSNHFTQEDGTLCTCFASFSCQGYSTGIYNANISVTNPIVPIPGLRIGCMPLDACLHSTLECFFNQTCVDAIIPFLSTSFNFTAMIKSNSNNGNPFDINATIESIVDQLMIEDWNFSVAYEAYYDYCAPSSCTYLTIIYHSFFYVVGTLIRLLAGLCTVLSIIVPTLVYYVRKQLRKKQTNLTTQHETHSSRKFIFHSQKPVKESFNVLVRRRLTDSQILLTRTIMELNLFKSENVNDEQRWIHHQRIASRLYILSLVSVFIILVFYVLFDQELYIETVKYPSEAQFTYLSSIYSSSLRCNCTNISIDFGAFLTLIPIYHQVCSSDFVSSSWLTLLHDNYVIPAGGLADFRTMAPSMFQLLAILCLSTNKTINDALESLQHQHIVTYNVLSESIFEAQINATIQDWKSTTVHNFVQTFQLFRLNIQGNQLMSNQYNAVWGAFAPNMIFISTFSIINLNLSVTDCSCAASALCQGDVQVLSGNTGNYFLLSGFKQGCSTIESLFMSSLATFYYQTIIDEIMSSMSLNTYQTHITALDPIHSDDIHETIESIINRLFVDQWVANVSYGNYYRNCFPDSCVYEVLRRRQFLVIITTIIGVLGGLTTGLKILGFSILNMIRTFQDHFSLRNIIRRIVTVRNGPHLRNRLKNILVLICLVALYISYTLTKQRQLKEVAKYPSLKTYQHLVYEYRDVILQCPCSQISIPYKSFINLSVINYHQICSSTFVKDEWIVGYYPSRLVFQDSYIDFANMIPAYLQLLSYFCRVTNETVNNAFSNFYANNLIQSYLNPSVIDFNQQIQSVIRQFQSNIPNSFLSVLELMRDITSANTIMSVYRNNWKFINMNINTDTISPNGTVIPMISVRYGECDCALSKDCIQPVSTLGDKLIPGLMIGCYPLEALLKSTLECFYFEECLGMIGIDTSQSTNNTLMPLNLSIPSRFNISTSFEMMLNELLIEEWSTNVSYEQYYEQCSPSSCSFTYMKSSSAVDIITNVLGLYGGLMIIMDAIVAPLLIILCSLIKRPFRRIVPINH